jgi:hypothetical protein
MFAKKLGAIIFQLFKFQDISYLEGFIKTMIIRFVYLVFFLKPWIIEKIVKFLESTVITST